MPSVTENSPVFAKLATRRVRLFRNGANQALRIPKEFELPGKEALLHIDNGRLVVEPVALTASSRALAMQDWQDLEEMFPDVDEGLLPLDDVDL